mgnify:CR=1 FL=1
MPKGVVLKSTGKFYRVLLKTGLETTAVIRGKNRLSLDKSTNPIAVGDEVLLDSLEEDDQLMAIIEIVDRKNYLVRKSTNLSKKRQIIASNIDLIFLVVTLKNPSTQIGFIDRFLVSAESFRIPVTILFNKIDLLTTEEKTKLDKIAQLYNKIGYSFYNTSALSIQTIDVLKKETNGKQVLFAGNSGVGKSSLINALDPSLNLRINEISQTHLQGKHTTTFAEMHQVKSGGFLIDSPGVKAFGLVDLEKEVISHYFPEMRDLLNSCKFNNCLHLKEPNCAVKDALSRGEISESRYLSYQQMMLHDDDEVYRKNDFS